MERWLLDSRRVREKATHLLDHEGRVGGSCSLERNTLVRGRRSSAVKQIRALIRMIFSRQLLARDWSFV
jgi:hypothetical protein